MGEGKFFLLSIFYLPFSFSRKIIMISIGKLDDIKLKYDRFGAPYGYGSQGKSYNFQGKEELRIQLLNWVRMMARYGIKPKYILSAGTYVNKPGAHGKGIAIDVDGLWFGGKIHRKAAKGAKLGGNLKVSATDREPKANVIGNVITALSAPKRWKEYLQIEATLRMYFSVVLNYDYNKAHQDHWHCDLSIARLFYSGKSQIMFLQRSLNVFGGESLSVDGDFGGKTNSAFWRYMNIRLDKDGWIEFLHKIAGTYRDGDIPPTEEKNFGLVSWPFVHGDKMKIKIDGIFYKILAMGPEGVKYEKL